MKIRSVLLAAMVAAALPATAAERIRIVDEGALASTWTLVPATRILPPYSTEFAAKPEEVCLVIGYLVNADGTTSDFSLLKSWASGGNSRDRSAFWSEFSDLASRALAQWRYAPSGDAAAKPAYTAATFVFGAPDTVPETKRHCEVGDLATRLLELRYDPRASRIMQGGIFTRLDIDPGLEERYRQAKGTMERNRMMGR